MPLPRWLGRFNRVATNRASRLVAGHLPGMAIVEHEGRTSGRPYRTPVNVFRRQGGFVLALTYGSQAQWLKNVLAAGRARIVTRGRTYEVSHPRVEVDPERSHVPGPVGRILGLLNVDEFLLVDTTEE